MLVSLLIMCIVHLHLSENKVSNCGCNIDRKHNNIHDRKLFFINLHNKEDECPIRNYANIGEVNVTNNMVLISGREYYIGTRDVIIESDKEGPERAITLKPFYIDKYEVSNRDFTYFTMLTNYKTEAENFGDSFVFAMFLNNTFKDKMKDFRVLQAPWWYKVIGANWKHPYGPDSDVSGKNKCSNLCSPKY